MTKKLDIDMLPEHVSGVRRMVSDARNIPYQALQSLDEAKSYSDGTVILEDDDGPFTKSLMIVVRGRG